MSNTPRKRAPRTAAAPQQSQRERLLGRRRPSTTYRLLVDVDNIGSAREALNKVERAGRQTMLREQPSSAKHKRAEKQIADAQAAVDACYETIRLTALPMSGDVTWEALVAAHPPTAEQRGRAKQERQKAHERGEDMPAWPTWDDDEFFPAALEACCDNGMTADDWRAFIAEHVNGGELVGLQLALIEVNTRERVADPVGIPFGLRQMTSSR